MQLRTRFTAALIVALATLGTSVEADDQSVAATSPLQSLVDAAAPGSTILVAPGTYLGTLTFRGKNVSLQSTGGPEVTILDNTGGFEAVVDIGPGGALTGFTISHGEGVTVQGVGSVIRGNIILDTYGGIEGSNASPLIERNVFRNNTCGNGFSSGVLAFGNGSAPTVVNNVFDQNPCRAININPTAGSVPVIINNTIVRNDVGVRVDRRIQSSQYIFENNVIVGNVIGLEVDFGTEANNPTWRNNLVFGNEVNYELISDQTGRNGNISVDPQFADAEGSDYHLSASSPAIDAGDNAAPRLPTTDFEGDGRTLDGNNAPPAVVDLGADEFTLRNRPPVANAGQSRTIVCQDATPVSVTLDGEASIDPDSTPGTHDDIVSFEWFEDFGTAAQSMLGEGEQVQASFPGGAHAVTLRVTDHAGRTDLATITVTIGPASCDDGNACTSDLPSAICGCEHVPTPNAWCDDGNACTTLDRCDVAGTCAGTGALRCANASVCTIASCDPAIGCVSTPVNGPCDDFDPCTSDETCVGGACHGVALAEGAPCDDWNTCTEQDRCRGGYCYGDRMADWSACNDLNMCTSNDFCYFGVCQGYEAETGKPCDDKNDCTGNDQCGYGRCSGTAILDGTTCDDSNACTGDAACRSGVCASAVPFVEAPGSPITGARAPGVGDFNRDGYPDLVVQREGNYSRFVTFLGDGSGGFTETSSYYSVAGTSPAIVVVADFNLDAKADFAAVGYDMSHASAVVYLGDGAGGIKPASVPATPVSSSPTDVLTADFNEDGRPDVAVASRSTDVVTMLLGDGLGGFVPRTPVYAGSDPHGLTAGDFDRDGNLDLAVASGREIAVLLGDGSGTLSSNIFIPMPSGRAASSIAAGDFDLDGILDLAVADTSFTSHSIWTFHGYGNGDFNSPYDLSLNWTTNSVRAADLDFDGIVDLVVGFYNVPAFGALLGTGSRYTFRPPNGSPYSLAGSRVRSTLADIDRDGRLDVVSETWSPSEVRIHFNRSASQSCPGTGDCTAGVCDPQTGACSSVPAGLGTVCDDRNSCTTNDACVSGACLGASANGAICDDGNACTSSDTCGGGACSGIPTAGPPAVGSSVGVSRTEIVANITWSLSAGASSSSVLRGQVSSLPVGSSPGDETCLVSRVPAPVASASDTDLPEPGAAFWYLVRGENLCGVGPYGYEARNGVPTLPESSTSCP